MLSRSADLKGATMFSRATYHVLVLLAVFSLVGHAAPPPTASSLQTAWQNSAGKCGSLVEKNGGYEFAFDSNADKTGNTCVVSAGSDVVTLVPNNNSPRKQYLIIPLARIVLRILR
jgi:hypothetical protein